MDLHIHISIQLYFSPPFDGCRFLNLVTETELDVCFSLSTTAYLLVGTSIESPSYGMTVTESLELTLLLPSKYSY